MRAVLVARDDEAGDAVEGNRQAVLVGLGEHRVHALDHALDDAGGLSEPGGCRQHEDLGFEQPRVDVRPLITLALVGGDARQEVQVDRTDRLARRACGFECVTQDPRQCLGVRGRGRGLERAVEDQRSKRPAAATLGGRALGGLGRVGGAPRAGRRPLLGAVAVVGQVAARVLEVRAHEPVELLEGLGLLDQEVLRHRIDLLGRVDRLAMGRDHADVDEVERREVRVDEVALRASSRPRCAASRASRAGRRGCRRAS